MSAWIGPAIGGAIDLGTNLLNLGFVRENNTTRERLGREAMDIIGSRTVDPREYLAGTPAGGVDWDLEGYYGPNASLSAAFHNLMYGSGDALDETSTNIGRLLSQEKYDPLQRGRDLAEFFPEEPLNEYLSSELQRIGEGSRTRLAQGRQQAVGRALASGQTLQEAGGSLDALDYAEQLGRAGQTQGARASQEGMRSNLRLARGQAQAGAVGQQAAINASLAGQLAQSELALGKEREDLLLARARGETEALGMDEAARRQDREALLSRYTDTYITPRYAANAAAIGEDLQTRRLQGGVLANYSPSIPQFDFSGTQNAINSWLASQASKPDNSSRFGVGIGPFSWSN